MTYYEAKDKHDNIEQLQSIKQSLLNENDKIKKFKEALKNKLMIYHERMELLKVETMKYER
jgi:hypothetical protein